MKATVCEVLLIILIINGLALTAAVPYCLGTEFSDASPHLSPQPTATDTYQHSNQNSQEDNYDLVEALLIATVVIVIIIVLLVRKDRKKLKTKS